MRTVLHNHVILRLVLVPCHWKGSHGLPTHTKCHPQNWNPTPPRQLPVYNSLPYRHVQSGCPAHTTSPRSHHTESGAWKSTLTNGNHRKQGLRKREEHKASCLAVKLCGNGSQGQQEVTIIARVSDLPAPPAFICGKITSPGYYSKA